MSGLYVASSPASDWAHLAHGRCAVEFRSITKRYGRARAVDDLSLKIEAGEFLALLGPSGCGKTTTLRIIAGLVTPDLGQVQIDGLDVTNVPPHKRQLGLVPQSYALFPHFSVAGNVGFGMRMRGASRGDLEASVKEALALVQMQSFAERYPAELSGGQQQRVALARALAVKPKVLLLDEPMAALDRKLRAQVQLDIRALQKRLGLTTIMVTHDQEEAMTMADRIAVMDGGRIAQIGTPDEIYRHPASAFVSEFVGRSNAMAAPGAPDGSAKLFIRPEDVVLSRSYASERCHPAEITDAVFLGSIVYYHVKTSSGVDLVVLEKGGSEAVRLGYKPGDTVYVSWDRGAERRLS